MTDTSYECKDDLYILKFTCLTFQIKKILKYVYIVRTKSSQCWVKFQLVLFFAI